ncbi:hypothetical protein [Phenylobacterium sp. 58.2.17]|uniref:hypothetical protein n=1 Tax=Phenylobacterium sp. 58.2.17 TaxID=2969306 RepID=UPI0022652D82|nr:hypothetical protein [Phenylobacterium sp. 58.2.17]MCX7584887.1 hypothetical protein [Phenylobacterium sp. 58.2.17]
MTRAPSSPVIALRQPLTRRSSLALPPSRLAGQRRRDIEAVPDGALAATTKIGVLESRWEAGRNLSLRSVFDLVSACYGLGPDAYEYEMVGARAALAEALIRLSWDAEVEVIYLACHGDEDGRLALHSGEFVSRTHLANMLAKCGPALKGVYLGTCFSGREDLASFVLERCPDIKWIAGYSKEIDYVDSTALDMMFFSKWIASAGVGRRRLRRAVSALRPLAAGLMDHAEGEGLGFSAFVRSQGRVVDLAHR